MKKKIIILMLLAGIVLFFSCSRNEGAQNAEAHTPIEQEYIPAAAGTTIENLGFALAVNTGLYVLERGTYDTGDDTTRVVWGESVALGESIFLGRPRRLFWAGQTNPRHLDFIEIRRANGTEGWALVSQVVEGGRLAVVVDERVSLHMQPRAVEVSNLILSRRSVVVFFPETEEGGFVQVRGWDFGRQQFVQANNCYVRLASLSRRDADIQSVILLHTAEAITAANQAERRRALLQGALDYSDSVFYHEILQIAYPGSPSSDDDNY